MHQADLVFHHKFHVVVSLLLGDGVEITHV